MTRGYWGGVGLCLREGIEKLFVIFTHATIITNRRKCHGAENGELGNPLVAST